MTQLNGPDLGSICRMVWSGWSGEENVVASHLLLAFFWNRGPFWCFWRIVIDLENCKLPLFKLSEGSETNYCCSKLIKLKNEPADVQKYIRRAKLKTARGISSIWTNRPDMKLGEIVSYSNLMCKNILEFVKM